MDLNVQLFSFFSFFFLQEGKHKCIYSVETTSVCQSLCHTYKITEMFPYLSLTWSWYFKKMPSGYGWVKKILKHSIRSFMSIIWQCCYLNSKLHWDYDGL